MCTSHAWSSPTKPACHRCSMICWREYILRREHDDRDRALRADLPADVEPRHRREHQVEHDQVARFALEQLERPLPVRSRQDAETLAPEGVLDRLDERRLVVDDQDAAGHADLASAYAGTSTHTVVPTFGSDSISIAPPLATTACRAIASPRPKPSSPSP